MISKISTHRNPYKNVITFVLVNVSKFSLISTKMNKFSTPPRDCKLELLSPLAGGGEEGRDPGHQGWQI